MAFNLERWQQKVRAWWVEHGPRIKSAPIESAYPLLAASARLPFLAAYADDPGPAMTALVGITAGVGSNLVASVVQKRRRRVGRDGHTYFYRHKAGVGGDCPLRYRPTR